MKTTTKTTYEYWHYPGYGRDDHMADEVIARAARRLGLNTGKRIAAGVGIASHAVPLPAASVSLPAAPGVRRRMVRALREARAELARDPDCLVSVVCLRTTTEMEPTGGVVTVTVRRRQGRRWVVDSIRRVPARR